MGNTGWYSTSSSGPTLFRILAILLLFISPSSSNRMNSGELPPGWNEFKEAASNSLLFVDKSLMIEDYLTGPGQVIRITRPRRCGKTVNMKMLKTFFEIEVNENGEELRKEKRVNRKYFFGGKVKVGLGKTAQLKPLSITKYENSMRLQGRFPVVYFTFKNITGSDYREIEHQIKRAVADLFREYNYLTVNSKNCYDIRRYQLYRTGDFDKAMLERSLFFLSQLLEKHFARKVHVFVDDYDAPINYLWASTVKKYREANPIAPELEVMERALESLESDETFLLIRSMLGNCLRGNSALAKGLISGTIHTYFTDTLLNGLNNILEYNLMQKRFSSFYGFSQREVDSLLTRASYRIDREDVESWYRGYDFEGKEMYNPWSIIRYLENDDEAGDYWVQDIETPLADEILLTDDIQKILPDLVDGKNVTVGVCSMVPHASIKFILHHILVFTGYLAAKPIGSEAWELYAPNREMRNICKLKMNEWIRRELNVTPLDFYSLAGMLASYDVDGFGNKLREFLLAIPGHVFTTDMEPYYSAILRGLAYSFGDDDYTADFRMGKKYKHPDIVLISRPPSNNNDNNDAAGRKNAIVIRYKITKRMKKLHRKAKKSLQEITDGDCCNADVVKYEYIKDVLNIVLVFYARMLVTRHRICNNTSSSMNSRVSRLIGNKDVSCRTHF